MPVCIVDGDMIFETAVKLLERSLTAGTARRAVMQGIPTFKPMRGGAEQRTGLEKHSPCRLCNDTRLQRSEWLYWEEWDFFTNLLQTVLSYFYLLSEMSAGLHGQRSYC